jgi:hypothetical protein
MVGWEAEYKSLCLPDSPSHHHSSPFHALESNEQAFDLHKITYNLQHLENVTLQSRISHSVSRKFSSFKFTPINHPHIRRDCRRCPPTPRWKAPAPPSRPPRPASPRQPPPSTFHGQPSHRAPPRKYGLRSSNMLRSITRV